jgi:tetratricopeptide (TPR) repeat protein
MGWAQKRVADVHRIQGRPEEAIENYNMLFGVREWRGALTAEAVYRIGQCYFDQGNYEKAFAFFQRGYVLYEGYPAWAAKAYLGSADCLEQLGKTDQATATLREMLAQDPYAGLPEREQAQTKLDRLTQGGTAQ